MTLREGLTEPEIVEFLAGGSWIAAEETVERGIPLIPLR